MRILVALLCLAVPLQAGLEFESTRLNCRASPGDKKVVAEFRFKVTGDKPVKITRVKTSCGCTTAKLSKKIFAPGEAGAITTTFKLGDRMGLHQKVISVETDADKKPRTTLVLRTLIQESVEFSRSILIWKKGSKPSPKTVKIEVIADNPIKLDSVASSTSGFKAELVAKEPGRNYTLKVTPVSTSEKARAEIVLTANPPAEAPQKFTIRALVK